jgi:L-ascorbate metabolism protein UlaG (beta-lactamase superfamily)
MAKAKFRGKTVTLGGARKVPGITPAGKKVSHFYKDPESGKVRVSHAGDTNYQDFRQHKDPKRRANFRSRHNCDDAKKHTPKWVACNYLW